MVGFFALSSSTKAIDFRFPMWMLKRDSKSSLRLQNESRDFLARLIRTAMHEAYIHEKEKCRDYCDELEIL